MKFRLEIECDNDAFDERPHTEIARILEEAAQRVRENISFAASGNGVPFHLYDTNGNKCGRFSYSGAKAKESRFG